MKLAIVVLTQDARQVFVGHTRDAHIYSVPTPDQYRDALQGAKDSGARVCSRNTVVRQHSHHEHGECLLVYAGPETTDFARDLPAPRQRQTRYLRKAGYFCRAAGLPYRAPTWLNAFDRRHWELGFVLDRKPGWERDYQQSHDRYWRFTDRRNGERDAHAVGDITDITQQFVSW